MTAYIQQIDESSASGDLAELYETCRRRAGHVANILQVQSQQPAVLRESLQFYIQLMKSPNGLSAAQREMLATVVSNVNDCFY